MESFALAQFDTPDTADRAGATSATTAGQFYVASSFLEVCATFYNGEMPPDIAEKARYAKFRAVQIQQSLKQGLPVPPPPGSSEAEAAEGGGAAASSAMPSAPQ